LKELVVDAGPLVKATHGEKNSSRRLAC